MERRRQPFSTSTRGMSSSSHCRDRNGNSDGGRSPECGGRRISTHVPAYALRPTSHGLMTSRILILDYGSRSPQLFPRRVREARVFWEIHPPPRSLEWIRSWTPTGIPLRGAQTPFYDEGAPRADPALLDIA